MAYCISTVQCSHSDAPAFDLVIQELANQIAMHAVAVKPLFLSRDTVDGAELQKEMDMLRSQASSTVLVVGTSVKCIVFDYIGLNTMQHVCASTQSVKCKAQSHRCIEYWCPRLKYR